MSQSVNIDNLKLDLKQDHEQDYLSRVLQDFYIAMISREASLLGRREVLTGKAKFGILGDGKELPQIAAARAVKKGDWRSGYYRDQTMMFALGLSTIEDFFAQLYADTENDPFSGGRQMNNHFATPTINDLGEMISTLDDFNVSSDISCTGGQMARAAGLALASKLFAISDYSFSEKLTNKGKEVVLATIGDASTSEGCFWEVMNASAVTKIPLVVAVWDDGYGISVPKSMQTVKSSISKALEGFLINEDGDGMYIYTVKGWDYPSLCDVFEKATDLARNEQRPVLVHVQELTQPQGHSTSGSHERYKTAERLDWEKQYDCVLQMEKWILDSGISDEETLSKIKKQAKLDAKVARDNAWNAYYEPVKEYLAQLKSIYRELANEVGEESSKEFVSSLENLYNPLRNDVLKHARASSFKLQRLNVNVPSSLIGLIDELKEYGREAFNTHLYAEDHHSALTIPVIHPSYDNDSKEVSGYELLNQYFDLKFAENDRLLAFGEDVGQIGDVNQGFAGLQEKYGVNRVFDTGIREWTIMGASVGLAMRGFRPIAEIQYLDYLVYGLAPLTDDLATVRYRSNGKQVAPAIIRTRGHRLEGIWHAGSPMQMLLGSLRGMYICVPRNMTQAAGMYNTLIASQDPGLVIECLNGYRLKEKLPSNIGEYTIPLGVPEILQAGSDVTIVSYGSTLREVEETLPWLEEAGISVELIDVQTLLPFDLEGVISSSIKKTNRVIFVDEDVPGGATAYMMQEVLEKQGAYKYLDAKPVTLTAAAHRTPFGSDGDYFAKPNKEDIYEKVIALVAE